MFDPFIFSLVSLIGRFVFNSFMFLLVSLIRRCVHSLKIHRFPSVGEIGWYVKSLNVHRFPLVSGIRQRKKHPASSTDTSPIDWFHCWTHFYLIPNCYHYYGLKIVSGRVWSWFLAFLSLLSIITYLRTISQKTNDLGLTTWNNNMVETSCSHTYPVRRMGL